MVASDNYTRTATLPTVIDGDTFRCTVDLGFYVNVRMSCRLAGINAPDAGEGGYAEAKGRLSELLLAATTITVVSIKPDKYAGRFDAVVFADRLNVCQQLVTEGLAVVWDGKGAKPLVPWPPPS